VRFSINLATKPYLDRRLVSLCCGMALAVLPVLLAVQIIAAARIVVEMRRLDNTVTALRAVARTGSVPVSDHDKAALRDSAAFYDDIIARKAFSWPGLLRQMERSLPPGIAVTLLEPNRKSGMITMEGFARSFAGVRTCLAQLESTGDFTDVMLLSHGEATLWEQAKGVKFALSFRLKQP
jgi:type IV pilus assembly protein PilN